MRLSYVIDKNPLIVVTRADHYPENGQPYKDNFVGPLASKSLSGITTPNYGESNHW